MLRQLRTLYAKSNKIIRTFSHCTIDVKLLLIKSYCTSFYCGYVWSDYKKTTYNKLRVAFNNGYRRVLGLSYRSSASPMYTTHNINNMEALLRRSIYSFIERLMDSSNMIINTLMNSWYIRFNIWEFWNSKLYFDGHESKPLSPYLGFLLYFYKSQSYTLCNYTKNFKMFKTYHSEVI